MFSSFGRTEDTIAAHKTSDLFEKSANIKPLKCPSKQARLLLVSLFFSSYFLLYDSFNEYAVIELSHILHWFFYLVLFKVFCVIKKKMRKISKVYRKSWILNWVETKKKHFFKWCLSNRRAMIILWRLLTEQKKNKTHWWVWTTTAYLDQKMGRTDGFVVVFEILKW